MEQYKFITDAKKDDIGAVAIFVLAVGQKDDPVGINFVLTDISNQDGGRCLVETLVNDIVDRHGITNLQITYSRGVLPTKNGKAKVQRHEQGMFSVFGDCSEQAVWTDAFDGVDSYPFKCFVFAPFLGLEDIVYGATDVFISYGYNSRKSNVTIADFEKMNNVTLMNNCSKVIFPDSPDGSRVEGGRIRLDNHAVWNALALISPILIQMREPALLDSKNFALEYCQEAFQKLNIDKELTLDNLLSDEVAELAKGIKKEELEAYLFRSVDQVSRKCLDVEESDLSHICLWLSGTKSGKVDLVQGPNPWFDFQANPSGKFTCPIGLSLEDVDNAIVNLATAYTQNLAMGTQTPKSTSSVDPPASMEVDQGGYVPEVPGEDYGELMHARLHNAPSTRVPAPSP